MKTLTIFLTLAAVFVSSDLMAQEGSGSSQLDPLPSPSELDPSPNPGKQGSAFRKPLEPRPPQVEEGSAAKPLPEQGSSTNQDPQQGSSSKQGSSTKQDPPQGSSTNDGSASKQSPPAGSSSKQAGAPEIPVTGPAYEAYVVKRRRIAEIEQEISSIFANLSVGIRAAQKAQMARVKQLEKEKEGLDVAVFEAAVEAFRESGPVNRTLLRDVMTYANGCMGGNKFSFPVAPQKTLEICDMMIEKDFDLEQIRQLASRAAFHVHDFESALKHIDKLQEMSDRPAIGEYGDSMRLAAERWQRELELRENSKQLPVALFRTNLGNFKIELFEDEAPETVANFVSLVDSGFYDGKEFFESRRGEFCRTGSPTNSMEDGAGYWVANEAKNENARQNFAFSVSMIPYAPDLRHSSQFIICQRPLLNLDKTFTVFGRVIEGTEVILKIQDPSAGPDGKLSDAVQINSVQILNRRPGTEYVPKKLPETADAVENEKPAEPATSAGN